MAKKEESEDKESSGNKKPDKKLIFIIIGGLSAVFVGIGITLFFVLKSSNASHQITESSATSNPAPVAAIERKEGAGKKAEEKKVESTESDDKPYFYKFTPVFIVNIPAGDKVKYLQVEVQLMSRKKKSSEVVEAYAPLLRGNLVTLFSNQVYDDLTSPEGKEQLRKKALAVVQKTMRDNGVDSDIEQVLFTNFVIQ